MKSCTLTTAILLFPLGLVHAQTFGISEALLNGGLPPCAQRCYYEAAKATKINPFDIYAVCEDHKFNNAVSPCEEKCGDVEIQAIEAVVAIACGVVGGAGKYRQPYRVPNFPECANNCTSTAFLASGCSPMDLACICPSPDSLNTYIPCVQALCNETDRNAFIQASIDNCAPYGGGGSFNLSDIGGYLNYSLPPAPSVLLTNGSSITPSSNNLFTNFTANYNTNYTANYTANRTSVRRRVSPSVDVVEK